MTEQVNGTENQEKQLSDEELYALEWAEDEESSDASDSENLDDQGKAEGDDPASETPVANSAEKAPLDTSNDNPAEGVSDDIWANASEAQRQAYLKAQSDFQAMVGRHKSSEKTKAALQKELDKAQAALHEATREKGTYETTHPELFKEVETYVSSKLPKPQESSEPHESDDDLAPIFKLHPDAAEILNSAEWKDFESRMDGRLKEKYESDDPLDFASVLTDYKLDQAVKKKASENEALLAAAATGSGGTSSKPATVVRGRSVAEDYDAEWEREY